MALSPEQEIEIGRLRASQSLTHRATVPELENILYLETGVLDHGFVRVVDYMGDDGAVVQAARVSYGAGTRKISDDRGLIRYLMRHRHTTPFEMCELKIHVKLPIFVARQWIRHRTANVNEYSARYSILDREFYIPDSEYLMAARAEAKAQRKSKRGQADLFNVQLGLKHTAAQSLNNKQGREEEVLSQNEASSAIDRIKTESNRAYSNYLFLLNSDESGGVRDDSRKGLARELARMVLPVNYYTQWYWKVNLHNLLHFLSLRADSHAQYEIRAYADVLCSIVRKWVPHCFEAFEDYGMGGARLSRTGLDVVRRMVAGEKVEQVDSGLSPREWRELMASLGR